MVQTTNTKSNNNGVSVVGSDNGGSGVSLKSWIDENPNVLGDEVVEKWGVTLPFLFKVCTLSLSLSLTVTVPFGYVLMGRTNSNAVMQLAMLVLWWNVVSLALWNAID